MFSPQTNSSSNTVFASRPSRIEISSFTVKAWWNPIPRWKLPENSVLKASWKWPADTTSGLKRRIWTGGSDFSEQHLKKSHSAQSWRSLLRKIASLEVLSCVDGVAENAVPRIAAILEGKKGLYFIRVALTSHNTIIAPIKNVPLCNVFFFCDSFLGISFHFEDGISFWSRSNQFSDSCI